MRSRAALLTVLLLVACAPIVHDASPHVTLRGPSSAVEVQVEIADTPETRERGLMGRTDLPKGTGMLFVMDELEVVAFWMKDTLIPLDILFFDDKGLLVSSASMTPCREDPCMVYHSNGPVLSALEVPAGTIRESQIGAGWVLER